MTNEELKTHLLSLIPQATFVETGEFLEIFIHSENILPLMKNLKDDEKTQFDYLFCLTCIDRISSFEVVYHLLSKNYKHILVVKSTISNIENPQTETVSHIWKTAEFHEREVYDLFGVKFINHPDLRRIFLEDDWKGFPLRKNYSDPNMIEL
ncbi:MAG: NADH-quinone oxidoreductase subunit C [Bacteroidetes bacterium]|nr:NADH-quinone oxidoreductase subunit C [Bacteroidota bacterium]